MELRPARGSIRRAQQTRCCHFGRDRRRQSRLAVLGSCDRPTGCFGPVGSRSGQRACVRPARGERTLGRGRARRCCLRRDDASSGGRGGGGRLRGQGNGARRHRRPDDDRVAGCERDRHPLRSAVGLRTGIHVFEPGGRHLRAGGGSCARRGLLQRVLRGGRSTPRPGRSPTRPGRRSRRPTLPGPQSSGTRARRPRHGRRAVVPRFAGSDRAGRSRRHRGRGRGAATRSVVPTRAGDQRSRCRRSRASGRPARCGARPAVHRRRRSPSREGVPVAKQCPRSARCHDGRVGGLERRRRHRSRLAGRSGRPVGRGRSLGVSNSSRCSRPCNDEPPT